MLVIDLSPSTYKSLALKRGREKGGSITYQVSNRAPLDIGEFLGCQRKSKMGFRVYLSQQLHLKTKDKIFGLRVGFWCPTISSSKIKNTKIVAFL